jgi:hypothetical protein
VHKHKIEVKKCQEETEQDPGAMAP